VPGGAAPVGNHGKFFQPAAGLQWLSWIHLEDIVGILLLALDNPQASGALNGTAPDPLRNCDFSRELARALRGRFWPPFLPFGPPDWVLGLLLGEVAEVVTRGQRVLPARALALGYSFQFPTLTSACADLFPHSRRVHQGAAALAAR
jgi:NAD dependent epimerase/dehydratase family enzyme